MKYLLLISLLAYALSKLGFATRLWDCCKPSCSSPEFSGGHDARQCDTSMNLITDPYAESICEGGPSTTCLDQIPMVVNDNLAYAFAASPGAVPNICGKCFELTFTGEGKYETTLNHKKIAGKKLIVITSSVGFDDGGQFDIMIPGGGVGFFNGCAGILGGSGNLGKNFGGLLSLCEETVGWNESDEDIYSLRKSCLIEKCNSSFSNAQAKQGCLFLANWMEAAGNPTVDYKEVSCPNELSSKY